jgi:hypothetical protein
MEAKEVLSVDSPTPNTTGPVEGCPKCGEPWGSLAPVDTAALGGLRIRRCGRCGSRATVGTDPARLLVTCESCGLPFLADGASSTEPRCCRECDAASEAPVGLPEGEVVEAAETEVRASLDTAWQFVTAPGLSDYLNGVARGLAAHFDHAPRACRVVPFNEPSIRILGLPSGILLVSLGMLRFLEDEAELAFVLARELAHVASGEAATRLVRSGFGAVAGDEDARPDTAWRQSVVAVGQLGYGRRSELEADARALRCMLSLRYDPNSALRLLRRLKLAIETGDSRVAEVAVALPPPGYRARKLERVLYGRVGRAPVQRANREVFRRAAGIAALGDLAATRLEQPDNPETGPVRPRGRRGLRVVGAVLGVLGLALLVLLIGMLLRG